ncbi:MAG: hypothetical protein PHF63_11715 [Herbinix sp.]|nr:hypothetical protein [Herbinix sp.]
MLSNLVSFLFVIINSIKHYVPYKTNQIIIIILMVSFSFISYLLSNNGDLNNYIIRMWCYLALPFYFLYIDYLKIDKKMINFIFIINFLISILFLLLSLSKYSYSGYELYLGTDSAWLTLGYDNPNQTAMYLIINLIILYIAFNYYTNKIVKFMLLLDIIYIGKLLIDTSSRSCILIGLFITAITIIKRKYTISKYFVIAILLLPAIFMFVYPFLYESGFIYFFDFGGKTDNSSRYYMFHNVLNLVKSRSVFGAFGIFQLNNLHNGTLSVYSSLGFVGLLLFYIYFIRAYFHILDNGIKSKAAYISMIGLLAIFVHSCAEAAFIIGGSMYAGSISALILLTKLERKEVQQ